MALTIEWRRRLENYLAALSKLIYKPLGEIELQGFTTFDKLTLDQAKRGPFQPMPAGMQWGAAWEYGWFRGEIVLPEEASGEKIVARLYANKPDEAGESLVWVNGRLSGALDRAHPAIKLTDKGQPGERFEILAETYAGHGVITVGGEPTPYGVETVPPPPKAQRVVGRSDFGIFREAPYQLYLDLRTLLELRDHLNDRSLRVAEIDQGLMEVTFIADLELPIKAVINGVARARERLQPLLSCVNGSTMPTLFAFGHAHLDVAWLWTLQETRRKIARTLANQLALMNEYPEYIYLQSQACLLEMLKRDYPDLYERVKEKVRGGQIIIEGGTYVEPDTNLTGGESLIRQFLFGRKFFEEEFGRDCLLFWEPDVFGYSGALPQIMRGCGMKYFATAKLNWLYNGGEPFPYNLFIWQGIDGSEVLAHLIHGYGNETSPAHVIENWENRLQMMDLPGLMFAFGEGDGGGGANRDHLEFIKRERDLEGVPRLRYASPIQFFKDVESTGIIKNRYVGELYYACHRGTYTSQARIKRYNRLCEIQLREAELWASISQSLGKAPYPRQTLNEAWRSVLLNQFHDILPGSSIERVYEEAENAYRNVLERTSQIIENSTRSLLEESNAMTVFNSLSFPRTAWVALPEGYHGATSHAGEPLAVQSYQDKVWVEVKVPACGWTTLKLDKIDTGELKLARGVKTVPVGSERFVMAMMEGSGEGGRGRVKIENEFIRFEINERGELVNLYDKATHREISAGACNVFHMFKDVPGWFDAWDIDSMYQDAPVPLNSEAELELITAGPIIAVVRVKRRLNNSVMTQEIRLRRGSRRIDFVTQIDWQERHKLLKVNFPVNIHADEAIHEIQFGYIKRPNHASRPFDADRFEVSNHKWTALVEENRGAALLNDCKYGISVNGNSMNLTLLKSPMAPDMNADLGLQQFTYSLYTWNSSLADSPLIQEAYELNIPPWVMPGDGGEGSIFSVSAPNIIIESVKMAEAGDDEVIVRLYEAKRMATRCVLTTTLPFQRAAVANMLEEVQGDLLIEKGRIELDFRPFEIKTVKLTLES